MSNYKKPDKRELSRSELLALDAELANFNYKKQDWLVGRGAVSKTGAVIVKDLGRLHIDGKETSAWDCQPILYEQLLSDYEQWSDWKNKVEYAKRRRDEANGGETEEEYRK